tara:strand:+ start:9468 stop:11141 length:1674 start_codon:yes stop_codon:yes gene_type:complete
MFQSFSVRQGQTSNFSIDLKVSTGKLLSTTVNAAAVSIKGRVGNENISSSEKTLFTARGVLMPTDGFISKSKTMSVSNTVSGSGTTSEVTTYSISGTIPMQGQQQKIAQIVLASKSDEAFIAPPSVKVSKNTSMAIVQGDTRLMLKKTSTTVDSSSNITNCTLDVYLSSNTDLTGTGVTPTYELVLPLKQKITKSLFIDRVIVSPLDIVSVNGETKNVRIVGTPETPFVYTAYDADDNTVIANTYNEANGPTIKDGSFFENRNKEFNSSSKTTIDKNGNTVRCVSDNVPTNGVFNIEQIFPKTKEIIQTAINGSMAASGTNKIIFDSLTGVEVGDQIIMKEISGTSTVKVLELNPDTDNANECLLSSSVTAADDAVARFIRGTKYYINVSSTSGLSDNVPSTDPTITLNQYLNPSLNLKFTDTTRGFSINGQTVPGSGNQSFYLSFSGEPNKNYTELESKGLVQRVNQVTITLDGVSTKAFSITKTPVYSTSENLSDFSNTGDSNESGTEFEINNVAVALSNSETTNGICTITFNLVINKWGTSDLTSTLDLNTIVS